MRTATAAIGLALVVLAGGCNNNGTTEPTTIPATLVETFTGSLAVNGTATHRFTVNVGGDVAITLLRIGGTTGTLRVGLGVGTPADVNCTLLNTLTTVAGDKPQIAGTASAGLYCLSVYDVGNLQEPTQYLIAVAHP